MMCKYCQSEMVHDVVYQWRCEMCGYRFEIDPIFGGITVLHQSDFRINKIRDEIR